MDMAGEGGKKEGGGHSGNFFDLGDPDAFPEQAALDAAEHALLCSLACVAISRHLAEGQVGRPANETEPGVWRETALIATRIASDLARAESHTQEVMAQRPPQNVD